MLEFLLYLIPVIGVLWLFWKLDCDLTTWLYEKFGQSPSELCGKVIWVTGASSGIGAALAEILALHGAKIIISGTKEDLLTEVKRKCHAVNPSLKDKDVLQLPFDMTDIERHSDRFNEVIKHFGKLDILVNNAGRTQMASFDEVTTGVDRAVFDVNVFGVVALTRIVLRHWYTNKLKGQIAVTSSVAGKFAAPICSTYCASKHALHGYFESLRVESYHKGISVTVICPGPVWTNIGKNSFRHDINIPMPAEIPKPTSLVLMTSNRCAQLAAVAIVNKLDESWVTVQPVLIFSYLAQYLPTFSRWLYVRIMNEKQLNKMKNFEF